MILINCYQLCLIMKRILFTIDTNISRCKNTAGFKFLAQSCPVVSPDLINTVSGAPGKSQNNYN